MSDTADVKPVNPHRMKFKAWREEHGYEDLDAVLDAYGNESVVPALCTEECEVEPDGKCPHDCPSILLAIGLI